MSLYRIDAAGHSMVFAQLDVTHMPGQSHVEVVDDSSFA
jgi:hypothetical protein